MKLLISSLLGVTFSQLPITTCELNSQCINEEYGNDFCCTYFTVIDVPTEQEGYNDYTWGGVAENIGGENGIIEKDDQVSFCTGKLYNAEHEKNSRGSGGLVDNYDDLVNIFNHMNGFKERIEEIAAEDGVLAEDVDANWFI